MKFSVYKSGLLFFLFFCQLAFGQTTNYLINPTSDGGFEGAHGWTIVNAAQINKWYVGSTVKSAGSSGAYVSNTPSIQSITTEQGANSTIYIYKDFVVPANATSISISFKYKNGVITSNPPRCLFLRTDAFSSGMPTDSKYNADAAFRTVLSNSANWTPYTNSNPLITDRTVSFTSNTLVPGVSYRVVFEWSAINQTSYTQVPPICIKPTTGTLVPSAANFQPNNNYSVTFTPANGQNYGLVWGVTGGAIITGGQGTNRMTFYVPANVRVTQNITINFTCPTPVYTFNGLNSGPVGIDEVSVTYVPTPRITSISTKKGALGSSVTISGENFGVNAAANVVYLGGVVCPITSASETSIVVTIPPHASLNNFTVLNKTNKLICVSADKFLPINSILSTADYKSYEYSNNAFEPAVAFASAFPLSIAQKFALADINLDNKVDVVSYGVDGTPKILKNTATSGVVNASTFANVSNYSGTKPTYATNSSKNLVVADLNNDGKLDLASSNAINDGGFVSPNTSVAAGSPALGSFVSLLPSTGKYKVDASFLPIDINLDGRIDLFGLNGSATPNTAYYSKNNSINNSYSFDTGNTTKTDSYSQLLNFSNAYGGEAGDIDGDGRTDVVYGSEAMFIVAENRTTKGNPDGKAFTFNQTLYVPTPGGKVYAVKLADFDGDGKLDVAATNSTNASVSIARNVSTPGTIALTARQDFAIDGFSNTASLAISDMNGDGKPDIITGEYTFGVNSKIAYLQNTSTSGSISFAPAVIIISGSSTYQQLEIVDIDGDNKPDILAANTSNNTLDVFRNRIFESGEISSDQTICAGTTATTITSTAVATVNSGTVQYQWQKSTTSAISGFSDIAGETNASLVPGSVNVKTYYRRGSASSNSPNAFFYTLPSVVNVNSIPTIISVNDNTICGTGTVPISAKASSSLIKWYDASTGGNLLGQSNSNQTFTTPSISSSTTYYAEALDANGCISVARSAVQANLNLSIPVVTVGSYTSQKCDAGSFILSASTTPDGTINWYDSAHQLVGTGDTFITPVLTSSTDYYATASNCNGESAESTVHVDIVQSPRILDATDVSVCYGTPSVSLSATASAGTLNWYTASSGGSASISNATVSNIIASVTRYVSASITSGSLTCESGRTPVIITSIALPTITATTPGTACGLVSSSVGATPSTGATIYWYSELAATNLVGTGNNFTTPISQQNQTYYAKAIDAYGCTSASVTSVSVTNSGATVGSIPNVFALTNESNRTITATGLSGQNSYIWQRSNDNGTNWVDLTSSLDGSIYTGVSGTTASTANLTLSTVGEGLHLFKYRLKLTKTSCTNTYSNEITFKVADIYGECAAATSSITAYTSSSAKTGISNPSSVSHTNALANLNDGNNETGIIVQSNTTLASSSKALNFDGYDDYVNLGNPAVLDFTNTSRFTLEAWVKISSTAPATINTVFGKKSPGGNTSGFAFYVNTWSSSDRKLVFETSGYNVISNSSIPSDTWTHIAVSVNAGSATIFINGVADASGTTNVTSASYSLNIGAFGSGSYFQYKGDIDEARIWNSARTASEILNTKDADVTGNSGLLLHYKFNEGTGSAVSDFSSSAVNGTLTNFALSGSTSNWVNSSAISEPTYGGYITADLGSSIPVSSVRMTDFSAMSTSVPSFSTGALELSNDNTTWTKVVAAISNTTAPSGNLFSFPTQNARYVRIIRKGFSATDFYGISELAIYNQGYESVPYIRIAPPSTMYTLTGTRFNQSIDVSPIAGETISSYQWSSSTSLNSNSYSNLADISTTQTGTQTRALTINPYSNATPTYYKLKATQSNGCVITAQTLSYLETVPYYPVVSSVASLQNLVSWTVNANGTAASTPVGFNAGKYFILQNSANNGYSIGASWTNNGTLKLNGNKLTLGSYDATIATIEDASTSAYILTSGTGYLKATVDPVERLFPVGTMIDYAPVSITNNTGTDDVFSVRVSDGSSNVTNYIDKTWTISKVNANSGGRNVDLKFEWNNADIQGTISDPILYMYNGSSYVPATGTAYTKTANSLTITGYTGALSGTQFRIYNVAPAITSFTPSSAGASVDVVITGTGFLGATSVSFGGTAATTFTVNSATKITARVAAGTSGIVSVTTPGGTATLSGFTFINSPTISYFTPAKTNQGATVTIIGTGFTGATAVSFGGVPAYSYSVVSSTQITAVLKAGSASGDVSVTTNGGTATKSGFVFGLPYTSIDRIAGWAATNTSTQAATYSATYTNSSVVSGARQSNTGLTAVNSTDSKWTNTNTSANLVTASAPYIKLVVTTSSATKFDRMVIPGLNISGTTKLQLRWSVDNYAASLGEFSAASGSSYALSSINLMPTATQPAGEIEFRVYAYNGNSDVISWKNGNSYTSLDGTPSTYSNASDAITVFGVTKPTPTLGTLSAITANLDDAVQVVSAPSSPSAGAFTYSLSSNTVASVTGAVLSYVGVGTATLTVTQAATEDYATAATSTSVTIKTPPSMLFNGFNVMSGGSPVLLSASSNSAGAFSYSSANTSAGTISGTNVVISGIGHTVLSAVQAANGYYTSATEKAVLVVKDPTLQTPALSWTSITTKTLGMPSFSLVEPISASAGAFTYYSSDETVATVSGDVVTMLRPGTATIIAVQAADGNYNAAQISMLLVVKSANRLNATLTGLASYTKIVTDNAFTITAPTSTWNAGPSIVYKVTNPDVATVSGNTITIKGVGTTKIIAIQEGSGLYNGTAIESTLTVNLPPAPVISYTSPASAYTKGSAITAINPSSTGGAVVSYSIFPGLPSGITLNTGTGVISGTPSFISGPQTYTISATNLGGTATATVNLAVNDVPPSGLSYTTPSIYVVGTTITTLTPTISGGPVVTYTITPSLPGGLTFDPTSGEIDGLPSSLSPATTYTVTATNTGGSTSTTITLTVNDMAPVSLAYITPNVISKGNAITPIIPSSTGGQISTYSVTPALPAGLTLDTRTGVISGTALTVNTTMNTYTITGSNVSGQVTATVEFLVNDAAPNQVAYSSPNVFTKGATITPITFTNTGGTPDLFFVDGDNLPAGLTLNTVTGVITGTPTELSPATDYIIYAQNFTGTYSTTVNIAVNDVAPASLVYTSPNVYTVGTAITPLNPTVAGGAVVSYAINPALPTGLSLNTTTGSITGTPTVSIAATTYSVTATNSGGSTSAGITLMINKRPNVVGVFLDMAKVYGDAPFELTAPQSNSTGAITYSSSNTAVATISGTTVTIVGTGSTTITASIASDATYLASSVSAPLIVANASATLGSMAVINKTFGDSAFTLTAPSTNSPGAITYTSSNAAVATISGTTVTIVGAGTATITATQAATTNFGTGNVSTTLVVAKATPVIGTMAAFNKTFGNAAFTLTTPSSTSSGTITFSSSDPAIAAINGNTVSILGAGTVTITANQAATANYVSGTSATTLTIAKATPTLGSLAAISKTYGNTDFMLTAPITNSSSAIIYTVGNEAVATITGNIVTIVGAGTTTITATIVSDANYVTVSTTTTLTVAKAGADLGTMAPISKTYGDAPFVLTAPSSSSNAAIVYTSSNTSVATISGSIVTIVGAGTATITATQAANANFLGAAVSTTLTIAKASPNLGTMAPISKTYGDAPFVLTAPSSSSNAAIVYTSSNTSVATISGATVTIVGAGTATITAAQATNTNYIGGSVSTSLIVAKAIPTLGSLASISKNYGDAAFNLVAPSTNSTGAITYASNNPAVATINGNKVTIVGAGTAIVTATIASDAKYVAKSVTTTLTVAKATPVLSGFFSRISKASSDPSFVINYPVSSGGTGAIRLVSSNIAVVSIVGNTAIVKGPGVAVITATQAADDNYNEVSVTGEISVLVGDSDGDGVPDSQEIIDGTDPFNPKSYKDTDGDGVPDYIEIIQGTSPWDPTDYVDSDGDGIPDYVELINGSDPNNPGNNKDSDGDGVPDAIEKMQGSDPKVKGQFKDSDGDGVPDYIEFLDKTNPLDPSKFIDEDNDGIPTYVEGKTSDSDGDGIPNYAELDSDNDGVSDRIEAGVVVTRPVDTDGDGTPDYMDLDSDNDGISDEVESDLDYGGLPDCDKDGIINRLDADICMNYSPQGVSPNGDGENDYLAIPSLLNYPPCSISIYDRAGNLVFFDEVYKNLWGGKNNKGEDLPDGTYFYILDFHGEKANMMTFVYLSRLLK